VFFGGLNIQKDEATLKSNCPHIVVGTPGRILALVRTKKLNLKTLKHFVLDECDKMLEALDMRRDVQEIFRNTPHEKQVMMFSATLSKEIRPVCKKFMQDVISPFCSWPFSNGGCGASHRCTITCVQNPNLENTVVAVALNQTRRNFSLGRGLG